MKTESEFQDVLKQLKLDHLRNITQVTVDFTEDHLTEVTVKLLLKPGADIASVGDRQESIDDLVEAALSRVTNAVHWSAYEHKRAMRASYETALQDLQARHEQNLNFYYVELEARDMVCDSHPDLPHFRVGWYYTMEDGWWGNPYLSGNEPPKSNWKPLASHPRFYMRWHDDRKIRNP